MVPAFSRAAVVMCRRSHDRMCTPRASIRPGTDAQKRRPRVPRQDQGGLRRARLDGGVLAIHRVDVPAPAAARRPRVGAGCDGRRPGGPDARAQGDGLHCGAHDRSGVRATAPARAGPKRRGASEIWGPDRSTNHHESLPVRLDVDGPWTGRGTAAAATWIFRRGVRQRGRPAKRPSGRFPRRRQLHLATRAGTRVRALAIAEIYAAAVTARPRDGGASGEVATLVGVGAGTQRRVVPLRCMFFVCSV